jgi:hypothetical protein
VGDGSTTFNLPDMRGRNAVGKDDMGGVSADRITDAQADILGGSFGAETTTVPAHDHGGFTGDGVAGLGGGTVRVNTLLTDIRHEIPSEGAVTPNILNPGLTSNWIIKN